MKKVVKLFLLVITCLFVFSLTSCAVGTHADAPKVKPNFDVVEEESPVLDRLDEIDPLKVTPMEAINLLYELKELSKK